MVKFRENYFLFAQNYKCLIYIEFQIKQANLQQKFGKEEIKSFTLFQWTFRLLRAVMYYPLPLF